MTNLDARLAFVLFAATLLLSCAGPEDRLSALPEKFTTHIYDNGLKQFQFQLMDDHPVSGAQGGESGVSALHTEGNSAAMNGAATSRRREGRERQTESEMVKRLEIKLKEMGYCRSGYILSQEFSTISIGDLILKGECKEGATDADKVAFPNTSR